MFNCMIYTKKKWPRCIFELMSNQDDDDDDDDWMNCFSVFAQENNYSFWGEREYTITKFPKKKKMEKKTRENAKPEETKHLGTQLYHFSHVYHCFSSKITNHLPLRWQAFYLKISCVRQRNVNFFLIFFRCFCFVLKSHYSLNHTLFLFFFSSDNGPYHLKKECEQTKSMII